MTQDKKLKQQIRERAKRTGESYATARRLTLAKRARAKAKPMSDGAVAATQASGATGSVSDAKCIERTGHGLKHWYGVLDAFDAATVGHTASARHLRDDHKVSPWYSQGITVAYERERGLRAVNQNCQGHFEVSVSRTLSATLQQAQSAMSRAANRKRWMLAAGPAAERLVSDGLKAGKGRFTSKPGKAVLRWRQPSGHYELELSAMPDGRSRMVVRCTRLPQHSDVAVNRKEWRQFADALRDHLLARSAG